MDTKKGKYEKGEKPAKEGKEKAHKLSHFFNRFSAGITKATGSANAFIIAAVVVIVWGITGPVFNFSDTWQLVINTGTTIITFLMVFIIQHSQNKDTVALQLKLNELIAASHASNKLISVEDLTDEELEIMKKFYEHLSGLSKKEKKNQIHSIEEQEKEKEKGKETEEQEDNGTQKSKAAEDTRKLKMSAEKNRVKENKN